MPASTTPGRPVRGSLLRAVAFVLGCVLLALAIRVFAVQVFTIPSESMQPALQPAERIAVWRPAGWTEPERGDLVVIDGRGSFVPGMPATGTETVQSWLGMGPDDVFFVKRVIGIGGDRISCCDDEGRLRINGEPVDEPYLAEPDADASATAFDVEVPADRLWLMGDNRNDSRDSRALLGAPGGGMISQDRVIGEAIWRLWPGPERLESVDLP